MAEVCGGELTPKIKESICTFPGQSIDRGLGDLFVLILFQAFNSGYAI